MKNLFILVIVVVIVIIAVIIVTVVQIMNTKSISQSVQPNSQQTSSKLVIKDIKIGSGKTVKSGDTVVINYTGKLTNGKVFDSSYNRHTPFTTQIGVGEVIKGWDEGIPGMREGGERELIIPPDMAYGTAGVGEIPPNATLIFDVSLVSVK